MTVEQQWPAAASPDLCGILPVLTGGFLVSPEHSRSPGGTDENKLRRFPTKTRLAQVSHSASHFPMGAGEMTYGGRRMLKVLCNKVATR